MQCEAFCKLTITADFHEDHKVVRKGQATKLTSAIMQVHAALILLA